MVNIDDARICLQQMHADSWTCVGGILYTILLTAIGIVGIVALGVFVEPCRKGGRER